MGRVATIRAPRAAGAEGRSAELRTELADGPRLSRIAEPWRRLADEAAEPNVFYAPHFALPAIEALGFGSRIRALLVWRDSGRPTLAGLFPFVMRWRWGFPLGVAEAMVHPYGPASTPLIDARYRDETLDAFARWTASEGAPRAWLFRLLPQDGAVTERLCEALRAEGRALHAFAAHGRAVLDTGDCDAEEIETALSGRHRKELRRQARRLGEVGEVALATARAPAEVAAAMEAYLELEAAGWKGRYGSAAKGLPEIAEMFRALAPALAARDACRVEQLMVGGRPAAIAISLGGGRRRWLWKIAYDEEFAAFSPGVLLVQALTRRALTAGATLHIDSCALPGIEMIERLWPQRRPYCDLLAVPAQWGPLARLAVAAEGERRDMEGAVRWVRRRIML